MAADRAPASRCNPKIGSIEHVGDDGFIVESADTADPQFIGGKRLFQDFDSLLKFLAEYLDVFQSPGNSFGIKKPKIENSDKAEEKSSGGNGVAVSLYGEL